jgi:hypothetical protein
MARLGTYGVEVRLYYEVKKFKIERYRVDRTQATIKPHLFPAANISNQGLNRL